MKIQLLVVPDCPNTTLALTLVRSALERTGIAAPVTVTLILTEHDSVHCNFGGSPTFLIDGHDPFMDSMPSTGLACRLYPTTSGLAGVPSLDEMCHALYGPQA